MRLRPKRYGRTLDLERRKGHCAFCDAKLRGRQVVHCGTAECLRDYNACYRDRANVLRQLSRALENANASAARSLRRTA